MTAAVTVSANERAFIEVLKNDTAETCQHIGCSRAVLSDLSAEHLAGFRSLSMRGLAEIEADGRLTKLESEFANGLDGIANLRQVVPEGKLSNEWQWACDPPTELIDATSSHGKL